eukprot:jgi/Ulvmu1/10337/UM061_0020.1
MRTKACLYVGRCLLPGESAEMSTTVLMAWRAAVVRAKPDFKPSCFLTDESDAEQKAVECLLPSCLVRIPYETMRHGVLCAGSLCVPCLVMHLAFPTCCNKKSLAEVEKEQQQRFYLCHGRI